MSTLTPCRTKPSIWKAIASRTLIEADATLAQQALVEGDATQVMFDWAIRERTLGDVLSASNDALTPADEKLLKRMPSILRRQLEFPYLDGAAFVNAIRGRGDWAAVDEVWGSQPVSTSRCSIRSCTAEEPVEIILPDVAAGLGPGWVQLVRQTLGEMQSASGSLMAERIALPRPARTAAPTPRPQPAGVAIALCGLDGPDGAWAVIWQTDWDTKADQQRIHTSRAPGHQDLAGAMHVSSADLAGGLSSPVLVLVADSDETLRAVEWCSVLGTGTARPPASEARSGGR